MKKRKVTERKSFKVLVTVICFLLVISLITAGNPEVGNLVTSFIFVPIQQAVSGNVKFSLPKNADELKKENSELKEENRKLNDMLVDYYDLKKENEELYKFYEIKRENSDFSVVPAAVINKDPNENFYGFTLDKGKHDGVRVDNPVITENGLVGIVCEVNEKSCKVSTILSPLVHAGAIDKKTDDAGIINGSAKYCDKGLTIFCNIPAQNKMETGDIIVTSGFGGIYPRNIKIGTISEIITDSYTGIPIAVVKPFENIKKISMAAIITDFSGKGEIAVSEQSKPVSQISDKNSSDKSKQS